MNFVLIAALGLMAVLLYKTRSKYKMSNKLLSESHAELSALKREITVLEKYKGIADVEAHTQNLRNDATEEVRRAKEVAQNIEADADKTLRDALSEALQMKKSANDEVTIIKGSAEKTLHNANKEASLILKTAADKAEAQAQTIKSKADQTLADAKNDALIIIKTAEAKAKEIAGSAFEALQKVETLEKTAQAMKNIIEGYGDQYIIPTYSLLDQLAEDYSHDQAGAELKKAREKTRSMIKTDTAALCEYVEANRKQTAIDFVLDAFNGKVDTILSSVKEDNFGTLSQKIKDAYQTVNHNGKAFRDARVAELFLASRLEELKWACTVCALRERDKEEQRRIREQIREEEKAAKEIEKAIKDAQKEEETLTKAMDKIKKDLESASEKQKEAFELKLKELETKLAEAEEKNKRALSLAQQTKTGHVYVISNVGSFGEDVLKIGMTRRLDPLDRVYELGDASVPFAFDVHAMILSEDAPTLEKELHKKFSNLQVNKVNARKEFFKISISEIRDTIENMNIQAQWTMTAEAREYRETIALGATKKVA